MLFLENITKTYHSGGHSMDALRSVSIRFRPCEFVAVLGHSGSGKTTLLNIIGGLDRHWDGHLSIRGQDTRHFRSRDWDRYRNHSVGFVFQSYHLIPHQTVFQNVELALTLGGVSRDERKRRTMAVLEQVGLADQMHKKPSQLSGGQMQRVAIARALVNEPRILLADEPTGSLDLETSQQVMELLKEIARNRLVIMVTHNAELAQQFATRTVVLKHGVILSDSDPHTLSDPLPGIKRRCRQPFMSPPAALSLSLGNLMSKKGRTVLTSIAGSIGIAGIAIILSLAAAINSFFIQTEKNLLSGYPLSITAYTSDLTALFSSAAPGEAAAPGMSGSITTVNTINSMIGLLADGAVFNDLTAFKAYIESGQSGLEAYTTDIRYSYATSLFIYREAEEESYIQVNPNKTFVSVRKVVDNLMGEELAAQYDVFQQVASDPEILRNEYELLAGKTPENWNELVLILNSSGQISDFTLYSLNVLDRTEVTDAMSAISDGTEVQFDNADQVFSYEDFLGMTFKVIPTADHFQLQEDGTWLDVRFSNTRVSQIAADAEELVIVGIMRPKPGSTDRNPNGIVGYTASLMNHLIQKVNESEAVLAQQAAPDINIFTGTPFDTTQTVYTLAELEAMIPSLDEETQTVFRSTIASMRAEGCSDEEIAAELSPMVPQDADAATYEGNLTALGVCRLDTPASIELYPIDFEAKQQIKACIDRYNEGREKEQQIVYADYVGVLMRSVTTVVNAVSYAIIFFVAISLIVSSMMIGIIANISVLERTREIGILRAMGASKRDISRVFNTEAALIGLFAGLAGIGITQLLILGINHLIGLITDYDIAVVLEFGTGAALVGISIVLTLLASWLPSRRAANLDPVAALRSE